jgi:Ca-activated chloride channel family protein
MISETQNPFFKRFNLFKDKRVVSMIVLSLLAISMNAQNADRHFIRKGNRIFHENVQESPSKAEVEYRKALTANPSNPQAMYNLGCALLAQNKDSLAMDMFQASAKAETSKQRRAMSYHNMGVIYQKQQQYGPAIEMYKQALRLTPHDNETRYNLVLCQRQQKQQDQNKNQNKNNQQNNKDNKNDKDNKDKDKENNKNDKNDQNKNKDNKDDQQNKDQQQNKDEMSRENAEQLLQAAIQNEKETQQRLNKAMRQPRRRNIQKNW